MQQTFGKSKLLCKQKLCLKLVFQFLAFLDKETVINDINSRSYYHLVVLMWLTDKIFGLNLFSAMAIISCFGFRHLCNHLVLQRFYESDIFLQHVTIKFVTTDAILSLKPLYIMPRRIFHSNSMNQTNILNKKEQQFPLN